MFNKRLLVSVGVIIWGLFILLDNLITLNLFSLGHTCQTQGQIQLATSFSLAKDSEPGDC